MDAHIKDKQTCAGYYARQPAGYRAFIPHPLPPDPPLTLSGRLQQHLSEANYALGRLDGAILTLPNPDWFVYMYVRKEAVLSSQIEGTQSSLQDVLAAEANFLDPDAPADVYEVINYVRAMNHGLKRLAELPVSARLIREIHAELMRGARGGRLAPGELRTSQNWIGPPGCTLDQALFVPPPHNIVPQALGDLERFLHTDRTLPVLVAVRTPAGHRERGLRAHPALLRSRRTRLGDVDQPENRPRDHRQAPQSRVRLSAVLGHSQRGNGSRVTRYAAWQASGASSR